MADTIAALATPLGRSGIGVVRLSGSGSLDITAKLIGDDNFRPVPRYAFLKRLRNPSTGEIIDETLVTYFKAPNSFTGEDVVEISCHGSPVLLRQVIDICLSSGARMAEAGEFSLRALANGRIDLAEAEAIRDLINAQTAAYAKQAVRQMRGEFSHQLQPIKDELLDIIVVLESAIEFVEDDLPEMQAVGIKKRLVVLSDSVGEIAATFQAGKLIREGIRVALVGRPNVGKSSLFNALLGSERAIVTEFAGTTRDQLHEKITIGDIPISLLDTAGLRETIDAVEIIGVQRTRRTIADSDIVLVMLDASGKLTPADVEIVESVAELNHVIALNKIDKVSETVVANLREQISNLKFSGLDFDVNASKSDSRIVDISAKTGEGLDALRQAIIEPFAPDGIESAGFLVSDARHFDLLLRAKSEIEASISLLDQKISEEIVLVGLHNALRFLGEITGETTTEAVLTRIFATFCIGK